jgi:hypothetical protein
MGKTDDVLKIPAKVRNLYKRKSKLSITQFSSFMWEQHLPKDAVVEPVTPRPKDKKKKYA